MALIRITAPSTPAVTLSEAKLHLRVDHDADDTLIEACVAAATAQAETEMQRAVMPQTWEVRLDAFPCHGPGGGPWRAPGPRPAPIALGMGPRAVTSIKYVRDSDGVLVTVNAANYKLDDASLPGWVLPAYDLTWPDDARDEANAVRVRFEAGWDNAASVPEEVKAWIKLATGQLYRYREASAEAAAKLHGFVDGLLDRWRIPVV